MYPSGVADPMIEAERDESEMIVTRNVYAVALVQRKTRTVRSLFLS